MKPENLLAPYLYQYKKLNLPGIGTFEIEGTVTVPDENNKNAASPQNVRFIQNIITKPDDEFIDYIKLHTGKMKPLAISDLESYLMLSKQFLNIGKPFQIEGIGSLQKMQDGSFLFTPEEHISNRVEGTTSENNKIEIKRKSGGEDKATEDIDKSGTQKAVIVLTIIATLALIAWGGYYLYKTNVGEDTSDTAINSITSISDTAALQSIHPDSSLLIKDTTNILKTDTAAIIKKDSSAISTAATSSTAMLRNIKFILETTSDKKRALYRFTYVNKLNRRIQLETKTDSSLFKIVLTLPATMADTTRIKDSLNAWYYGKREMKIRIE